MKNQEYTIDQVSQHNDENDCYIIIDSLVYDVTKFINLHPGGKKIILNYAGKDASEIFNYFHKDSIKTKYEKLVVGQISSLKKQLQKPILQFPLSDKESSGIPFSDNLDLQGWHSPYYTEKHRLFRQLARRWAKENLRPFSDSWEENGHCPNEVYKKLCETGMTALIVGKPWEEKYFPGQKQIILGLDLTGQLDVHYEYILWLEIVQATECAGTPSFLFGGNGIGLPPIAQFGSEFLKQKVLKPCLLGEKRCCLAITEPWAGSDVAGIKATAEKSSCGKFYIVNGIKKWITNGYFSDFFTVAVRTGEEGMMGISLLVLERNMPGFKMKKQLQMGIWTSGTALLIFENVKVPIENLIGQENEGFKLIMMNFNHERLLICWVAAAGIYVAIRGAFEYATKRETFGKKLIDHPVIRQKIAHMIRISLSCQALLELCNHNYEYMKNKLRLQIMPSSVSIVKAHLGICLSEVSNILMQIAGGAGYTREGQLSNFERGYREVKSAVILGGSEEIMLDLGIKLASRFMPSL